jgi:hypothetical protein
MIWLNLFNSICTVLTAMYDLVKFANLLSNEKIDMNDLVNFAKFFS